MFQKEANGKKESKRGDYEDSYNFPANQFVIREMWLGVGTGCDEYSWEREV
jgi:hypothetical protein